MFKFCTSIFAAALFAFGFGSNGQAAIVECSTTQDVLNVADAHSLVLFNVTDTLYVSSTTLGTAEWREYMVEKVNGWINDPAEAERVIINLKRATMLSVPKRLVEQTTPLTIEMLQMHQVPVLGYTQKHRSEPWISNFDEVVKDHLLHLGINFNLTSNYFQVPASENPKQPYFYYGIIFNEGKPRQEAFTTFLHHLPVKPERVIFVDNNKKSLIAIEEAAKEENIEFYGYRYNKNDEHKAGMDPILGILQLEQFLNSGTIMNDGEALQKKNADPLRNYNILFKDLIERFRLTMHTSHNAI